MYQLFIFFMITDPKTTVRSKRGQCLVAFLIAVVETMLRFFQSVYAPFYALFIVGPIANSIEIWMDSREKQQRQRWQRACEVHSRSQTHVQITPKDFAYCVDACMCVAFRLQPHDPAKLRNAGSVCSAANSRNRSSCSHG